MMEKVNEKALYIRIDAKDGKNMNERKHITCITFKYRVCERDKFI